MNLGATGGLTVLADSEVKSLKIQKEDEAAN
jgi:hypothetical protein